MGTEDGGRTPAARPFRQHRPGCRSGLGTVLAGCGGQGKQAAAGEEPDRDFLIGKWGTDGDCELAVDLRADGTSDGPFGDWSYRDGVISVADAPDLKVAVTVVDDATMESTNGQGKTSTMTRCP